MRRSPKSASDVAVMVTPGVLTRSRSRALSAQAAASFLKLRGRLVARSPITPKSESRVRTPRVKSENSGHAVATPGAVRMGRLVQNSPEPVAVGAIGEGVGGRFLMEEEGAIGEGVGGSMVADQVVVNGQHAPEPEVRIGAGGEGEEEPLADLAEMDRWARESTPPHLIRDPTILVPPPRPGRRPRRPAGVQRLPRGPVVNTTNFPHLDASIAELQATDRQRCIERYNFDPLTETPLPGRFEWEKVDLVP